jgi:radical SAM superfamily enzyme YgiQ (UPF0313 family)
MKILLIDPARYRSDGSVDRTRTAFMPAGTLPLLAALAPGDAEVEIRIDMVQGVDLSARPDVVGITGYTKSMARAYDLADEFRRRGVHVAMGGIHVSMEPDEALRHADTVFIGEAEETWPRFLEDLRHGKPAARYKQAAPSPMAGWPVPRYDLLDRNLFYSLRPKNLITSLLPLPAFSVETSRGCPHECAFCSVTPFMGPEYRVRPVEDVVAELKAIGARGCAFADNNLFGDHERAKRLMKALIPLKLTWIGNATIDCAEDEELLELAARSGCRLINVGMEAICDNRLSDLNKSFNRAQEYRRQLAAFSRRGISVLASMVFQPGFGGRDQFKKVYDFLTEAKVAYTAWWALTPLPGTRTYRELQEKGLLRRERWWLHKPGPYPDYKMSGPDFNDEEFFAGYRKYYRKFYSLPSILRRLPTHCGKGWWAEVLWNLGLMTVAFLRRDAINLYSPLGDERGWWSFLRSRFFLRRAA